jgi:tol-pal system protein YbgF
VREKLDDNNVRVGSLAQEVDSLRELITALPRGADVPVDPAAGDPLAGGAAAPAGVGASPERFWTMAMADYYGGDYDIAIQGFTTYLAQFPRSDRADDAQFYVGQSYYTAGKYDEAIKAYEATIRNYPSSDLLSEAYFKLGEAYRAQKNLDRARSAYQHVIKTYPDTAPATQAQQRLQEIK